MPTKKRSNAAQTGSSKGTAGADDLRQKKPDRPESQAGQTLVVVESPAKAKTINKYLGRGYIVRASMGHVRDLPGHGLAVDIQDNFRPTYQLVPGRKKVINELRKLADKAEAVYLATDLDREGEAIAWHLAQALELDESKTRRVVFNEITKGAIQEAFSHPRHIDMDKVNAQQARRILDRIVGYELSPLLWKKIAKGLSAGRVQSVAVRMVVEREKEIRDFIPTEHWTITGCFSVDPPDAERLADEWQRFKHPPREGADDRDGPTQKEIVEWLSKHKAITADLVSFGGDKFKPSGSLNGRQGGNGSQGDVEPSQPVFSSAVGEARRVAEALGFVVAEQAEEPYEQYPHLNLRRLRLVGRIDHRRAPRFRIGDIQTRRSKSKPPPPFTTATLQQAAGSQLKLSTSRTMKLAQQLYEGIELPGEDGPVALITYMRTDSTNLSGDSVQAARNWIGQNCGDRYVPPKPNVYGSAKRAQEAHEAIRPTDVMRTPESLKHQLSGGLMRLYDLIWRRFVACQMPPAEWDATTVLIEAETSAGQARFEATGRMLVFDGFYKVQGLPRADEQLLPSLEVGRDVGPVAIEPEQRFTSPPSRYSEATLVKRLESEGIGRPSTYAAIIQTIQDRGYVEQMDRRLYATDKGMIVTDKLMEHFPDVMEYKFTSYMEDELDKIEEAHLDWVKVLHEFYDPFHADLVRAHGQMQAAKAQPSPYKCPSCGSEMVYRWAKTGRFLSCANYPECKGAMNIDREGRPVAQQQVETRCEVCGRDMVLRQSRHGPFLGCSGYPECTNTVPCDAAGVPLRLVTDEELAEPCPACGEGTLRVKRARGRAFLGCDRFPECKNTKPLPEGVRLERKAAPSEEAGFACERCGRPMLIKTGRRGKFISCSGFPRCRNAKPIEKLEELKAQAPAAPVAGESGDGGDAGGAGSSKQPAAAARGRSATKGAAAGKGKSASPGEDLGPPPPGFAWTRTGKPVVEMWPEDELHCPQCGSAMQLKSGRFGPFFSCTNFPRCRNTVNLRGEAKKRAEIEVPPPPKTPPVPTDIPCDECGQPMLIRTGRSGKFLGCSQYPKCKATRPLPAEPVAAATRSNS